MLTDPRFENALRRTVEANLRFYGALGQVTLDYLKSLGDLWRGAIPPTLVLPPPHPQAPPASVPAPPPAPAPVLVLEAEAGGEARGVFLVNNRLARRVSAPVVTSAFADPSGRVVYPPQRVEPEVVTLEPGAQSLVQIVVIMSDDLDPGISYRAEISVPGLSDGRVPIVLRRRIAEPTPPPPAAAPKKARRKKA